MNLPAWGDFGGRCVAGLASTTPAMFLPDKSVQGLRKSASYLLGTWRDERGEIFRLLRCLEPHASSRGCFVFSTEDSSLLARVENCERMTYRGETVTEMQDDVVSIRPRAGDGFSHRLSAEIALWEENELLSATGERSAPTTQWYNPWPDGGGALCVTAKFRSTAMFRGRRVEGFFAHEVHFFPDGLDFINSPFGTGGREFHWGHMATEFDDGSTIDASLAIGADGWGFAMITDEQGTFHLSTQPDVRARVRTNGMPERIDYRFGNHHFVWRIAEKGERASFSAAGLTGAEGIFTRANETRRVRAAMGTIDWWLDGRAEPIIVRDDG